MGQSVLVTKAILPGKTQSLIPGACRPRRQIDNQASIITNRICVPTEKNQALREHPAGAMSVLGGSRTAFWDKRHLMGFKARGHTGQEHWGNVTGIKRS